MALLPTAAAGYARAEAEPMHIRRPSSAVTVSGAVVLLAWLSNQPGFLASAPAHADGPSPRYAHQMMTFDDRRGQILLFGGAGRAQSYGDLWAFDDAGWHRLSSEGPPERDSGVFVYDSVRDRSVLYGGRNATGELHDTWEWDGSRWHAMASTGPGASVHGAAAFDRATGSVVVLFPILVPGRQPRPLPSETWTWNGRQWSRAAAATTPNDVMPTAMTAELSTGVVYLLVSRFGSDPTGVPAGPTELWAWTGRGWRRTPGSPPALAEALQANMSPAGPRGLLLYHAGEPAEQRGTWKWERDTWTRLASEGPSPRTVHVMAYDSKRGYVALFGGSAQRTRLGDTWTWDGRAWREFADRR